MNRIDLEELREPREYPAVSLLSPLQRHHPGNPEDRARLRHLANEARRRLRAELGPRASTAVFQRLQEGIESIDLNHPSEGVAVFATPTETRVLALCFAVPERVVVDDAFETRDLARGLARSPRYRLLALALKPTRLLESDGSTLVEIRVHGFPMFVEGARGEPIASGGYAPHSSRSEEQHEQFFRLVDRALGANAGADPLPLVLAGSERELAYFDKVTEHAAWIIGRISGNHERTAPDVLAHLAMPVVEDYLAEQRALAVAALDEAIGADRAVVGIKPTWQRALEGRGRMLLVEEDFEYPARIVNGDLEPAGELAASEVLDDAVDMLVDLVLEAGGDAMFVEPGALGVHGPVAMLLRY
jgi:hypothetical protein